MYIFQRTTSAVVALPIDDNGAVVVCQIVVRYAQYLSVVFHIASSYNTAAICSTSLCNCMRLQTFKFS